MKAISLSINTLIILVIAVLVLFALVFFFGNIFTPGSNQMSDYDAWNRGCSIAKFRGCGVDLFKEGGLDIDGYGHDLNYACGKVYGLRDDYDCQEECCDN